MRTMLGVILGCTMMLAAATLTSAKEGARAQLAAPVSLDAAPGTAIRIRWLVDVPDNNGGREPFGAGGMFVRLLDRSGGASTMAFGSSAAAHVGRYAATVQVPANGIGGIRVGLRGEACGPSGCRPADAIFPLENDPFLSAGGVRCDVAAASRLLRAFVRAFNRGDAQRLDGLFSQDGFVWYSSGPPGSRRLGEAKDRSTLIAYFRRRHSRGDRLEVLTYRFNAYESARELGHFQLTGRRRADDFRSGSWFRIAGKGALDCSKPPVTIAALSIGGTQPS